MSYNSFRNDNNGAGQFALIQFRKSNNFASVANLDLLGQILWSGYDAGTSTYKSASYIYCQAVGAPAANVPSQLQFNTSFGTGTQLAMNIGQYGQVEISDPATNQATLIVNNNQSTPNINLRTANATPTNAPHMHFNRSRVGTGAVSANDDLGRLEFFGFQGGTAREAAEIKSVAQSVNGTNAVSSYLSFSTVPTTYAAMAERMRISADGTVTINDPIAGNVNLDIYQTSGGTAGIAISQSSVDTFTAPLRFFKYRGPLGDILTGDSLGETQFFGRAGGVTSQAAIIQGKAGTLTGAFVPGFLKFYTNSTANVLASRLEIAPNGNVTINAPTSGTALTVIGATGAATAAFTGTNAGGIAVTQSTPGADCYRGIQTSADFQPMYFNAFKSRAGGIITANDVIYQLGGFGFADAFRTVALHRIFSTNVGANFVSGGHDWWTTSTAGTTSQRMVLQADGFVTINAPAATGQALTVNGFPGTANYAFVSAANVSAGLYQSSRFLNVSTTAGSGCRLDVAVNQQPITTGGETFVRFVNEGIQAISVGLNTATRQYVMGSGSTLAANPFFTYTIANNQINLPLQVSFGAYLSVGLANQTGAGGAPDIAFNSVTTNVGNAYNAANGRVTAPVTGKYLIGANVTVNNISALMTEGVLQFWRYNAAGVAISAYAYNYINPAAIKTPGDYCSFQGHIVIPMNETDYVTVKCILLNGAADTAGYTALGARETSIYGQLLS